VRWQTELRNTLPVMPPEKTQKSAGTRAHSTKKFTS
jgi:hypothetical protein